MDAVHLLVVAEDQQTVETLAAPLTGLGYVWAVVASGAAALRQCAEARPDLILCEPQLDPSGDWAAQFSERFELPVVWLGERAGADPTSYVTPPFTERELQLVITSALYRHQAERRQQRRELWVTAVLAQAGDAFLTVDVRRYVTYVSPAAEAWLGGAGRHAVGRPAGAVLPLVEARQQAEVETLLGQVMTLRQPVTLPDPVWLLVPGRREILVDLTAAPIFNEHDRLAGAVLSLRDITERRQAEESLRHLAHYDALTGLPNRALFQIELTDVLTRAERERRAGALVLVDLDRFKKVNDTLGHGVGDRLLQAVVGRLAGALRQSDRVARLGGDEFAVLLENIDQPADAARVAEKVLSVLAEPFEAGGQEIFVSVSLGVALFPADGAEALLLLKNADTALYRAKEQGRNGYAFYHAAMNAAALAELTMESGLRRALQRGEFMLFYQPKVALDSGQVVGVEALLRWQHPQLGLLPPAQFIPLAEETGLILPIGQWALRAACQQAVLWQAAQVHLRVAVNLSLRQFRQADLVDRVARTLSESGLAPERLELELTESSVMHDRADAVAKLQALKRLGVYLSIDDFGTGYSALEYLKLFQVDALKIDRAFVHEAHIDREDEAILRAIVTLAHSLNMSVIAEGVETAEQHGFMQVCQCDETQGFFLGHPMAPEALLRYMTKGAGRLGAGKTAD